MKRKLKVLNIVGARPNMMKIAPLISEMRRHKEIEALLLHTGQHYDRRMSKVFFEDLRIPKPDIYLGVGSGSHGEQTGRLMIRLEKAIADIKPDLVVVAGDVNSTMAAAITASKMGIPVAHIEAGLRSFDRTMPEEINRIITDSLSSYLFAPSLDAVRNLRREGHEDSDIFLVGNIMIDSLLQQRGRAAKSPILKRLKLDSKEYATLTLHRPSNVDDKNTLLKILAALNELRKDIKIAFPMHLRTRKMIRRFELTGYLKRMKNVVVTPPLGYLDFLKLLCESRFVLTDSGGIQEETTALGIPCVTLRHNTERPLTITMGTNTLVGNDTGKILAAARLILWGGSRPGRVPEFWDGKTSARIVKIIRGRLA